MKVFKEEQIIQRFLQRMEQIWIKLNQLTLQLTLNLRIKSCS